MRIEQGSHAEPNTGYTPYHRRKAAPANAPTAAKEPEFAAELLPTTPRPLIIDTKRGFDGDAMYISTTTDGQNQYFAKIKNIKP